MSLIQINSAAILTFCHNVEAHIDFTSVPACLVVVFASFQHQPADFWSLVEATIVYCLSPFHFKTDTSSVIKIIKITVYLTGKEHISASIQPAAVWRHLSNLFQDNVKHRHFCQYSPRLRSEKECEVIIYPQYYTSPFNTTGAL